MQGSYEFRHASDYTNGLARYSRCIAVSSIPYLILAVCGCRPFKKLLHFPLLAFTLLCQKCVCIIIAVYLRSLMILENVN